MTEQGLTATRHLCSCDCGLLLAEAGVEAHQCLGVLHSASGDGIRRLFQESQRRQLVAALR